MTQDSNVGRVNSTRVWVGSAATLIAVLVATLVFSGAAAGTDLVDAGPFVRWSLPIVRVITDISGMLTLGGLMTLMVLLPAGHAASRRVTFMSAVAAVLWAIGSLAGLLLVYSETSGTKLSDPTFGDQVLTFITNVDLFSYLAGTTAIAIITSVLVFLVKGPRSAGMVALVALFAWYWQSQTGHSAGSSGHETAVSSWWLHVIGLSLWAGVMVTLLVARSQLGEHIGDIVDRYSTLAGWGYGLVAVSGVASASLRFEQWSQLGTTYGLLLLAKVALTVVLGLIGWRQRRVVVVKLRELVDRGSDASSGVMRRFWNMVAIEVWLFSALMAMAVTLSRTSPPVPDIDPDAVVIGNTMAAEALEAVKGFDRPWESLSGWFSIWILDLVSATVLIAAAIGYVVGLVRLYRRGDTWPWYRTVPFMFGIVALLWLTSGPPAVYGRLLFSAHMVQHMSLTMAAPLLLVLGAPITLLLRATVTRHDGSMGLREWTLWLINTPWVKFFSNPVVAAVNFSGSIIVFYFSSLFSGALSTHTGHQLMVLHFLLAGFVFASVLVGIDPLQHQVAPPVKLLILLATMAFHGFFGVAIMGSDSLLAATYFSSMGFGIDALQDQQRGGGIAWGFGEIPTLAVALLVAWQWAQQSGREAARQDRKEDRSGDADLERYNQMLEQLYHNDRREGPSTR